MCVWAKWGESPCNAKSFGTEHFKQIDVEQAAQKRGITKGKSKEYICSADKKGPAKKKKCSDVEITIWLETLPL